MTPTPLLALFALSAACGGVSYRERPPGGLEPIVPGSRDPALISAASCARCHPGQYAEWQASRHAHAWTNGIFRREYRELPRDWCVHCHAPLAAQLAVIKNGGGALANEGVGCASCHVRAGRIRSAERHGNSPHDTLVEPSFGGPATCANCHQFGFPIIDDDGNVRRLTAHPMQATVDEFQRGPHARAADGCRTCHATTPYEHLYPGGHSAEMMAKALEFAVCRDGAELVLSLTNRGAGHRVPTGDVHRHLNLRVWRSSAPERLEEIFLGRRFEPTEAGGKRTTWDSTLAPGERRSWRVNAATLGPDGPLRFSVDYVYTVDEVPHRGRDPGEPTTLVVTDRTTPFEELPPCTP